MGLIPTSTIHSLSAIAFASIKSPIVLAQLFKLIHLTLSTFSFTQKDDKSKKTKRQKQKCIYIAKC